ncbi:MAG: rhodanese-like domain-containing protein [Desulfopila sp.]|jgi:thiosulfate/3-mercaptopyruvate sulfurtransferase|nr:rhodanese-like domain-containing protein [Desulfopila sp.]
MENNKVFRHIVIAALLSLGVLWSFSSAAEKKDGYPNDRFIANAQWLALHKEDKDVVIVDVRSDDHFDGSVIPGAVHMPWSLFRHNDIGHSLASTFVGVKQAQRILGKHGITPKDTVVLYDSVARDGGATASYIFWILDVLGHEKKMILERGIDGWKEAGFERVTTPRETRELLYQVPTGKLRTDRIIDGDFVYNRLGDYYYQIIDVRSAEEYSGKKGTKGLEGTPLKLGHIPTAVNINYESAWADAQSKDIKSYVGLQNLYAGLDSSRGVIVYCNSGRRSSFSYYILRLMGFENVYTYEPSWKEWGRPANYYPVETEENILKSGPLPQPSRISGSGGRVTSRKNSNVDASDPDGSNEPTGGYVSCGG